MLETKQLNRGGMAKAHAYYAEDLKSNLVSANSRNLGSCFGREVKPRVPR